jgi:hypothetical protein
VSFALVWTYSSRWIEVVSAALGACVSQGVFLPPKNLQVVMSSIYWGVNVSTTEPKGRMSLQEKRPHLCLSIFISLVVVLYLPKEEMKFPDNHLEL